MNWTLRDGTFAAGATVPLEDRGFRYGMNVFETVAIHHGKPLFWEDHLTRLARACAAAEFPAPPPIPLPDGLDSLTGVLRLYVSAGSGTPTGPIDPTCYALFESTNFPTEAEVAAGWKLTLSRAPVNPVLGGWKTGNYWPHIQAFAQARTEGFQETLLTNPTGAIMSASMANVILIRDGRFLTPAPETGARDGVVKHWLSSQVSVEPALLTSDDFVKSESILLTNSRLGIMPVSLFQDTPVADRRTANQMARLYRETFLR